MRDQPESAQDRGRRAIELLIEAGRQLGYEVATEFPVQGGRLDVVWLMKLPEAFGAEPVLAVAFEVESSWRTRKHLKGDYLNLFDAGAAIGVLVLLGEGDDVAATRQFAEVLVQRPGPRLLVWSEEDLQRLTARPDEGEVTLTTRSRLPPARSSSAAAPPSSVESDEDLEAPSVRHVGKYRALWQWLAGQAGDEVTMTFAEIEEVIGMPLPPSSRRHAAHWHGYEGSAVARAIHDAGWQASDVSLQAERLTFRRRSQR